MKTIKTIPIALIVAQFAAACSSVRPVIAPAEFIPREQPQLIWVVDQNEEAIPVNGASLQADSIVGTLGSSAQRYALPLTHARLVLAKQHDRRRTTLFVLGMGAVAGVTAWRFAAAGDGPARDCRQPVDKEKRC